MRFFTTKLAGSGGGGGASLPLQTSADPETVVENAAGTPIFGTDSNGLPNIGANAAFAGSNVINFDPTKGPLLVGPEGNPGSTLGFDSSGNPQINGTFGIPKIVGQTSVNIGTFGAVQPGSNANQTISLTGVVVGDIILFCPGSDLGQSGWQSGTGGIVFSAFVFGPDTIILLANNTDLINAYSVSGTMYLLVLRP